MMQGVDWTRSGADGCPDGTMWGMGSMTHIRVGGGDALKSRPERSAEGQSDTLRGECSIVEGVV